MKKKFLVPKDRKIMMAIGADDTDSDPITIGRGAIDLESKRFNLDDPHVSEKHAALYLKDGDLYIENLTNINPVLVNSRLIDEGEALRLHDDDVVTIGADHFTVYNYDPTAESSPERPANPLHPLSANRFFLKILEGTQQGAELSLDFSDKKSLRIGRDYETADIVFLDSGVSNQHLKISLEEGKLFAEDLGSTNGSYLDKEKIEEQKEIYPESSVLQIGSTTFIVGDTSLVRETIPLPAPEKPNKSSDTKATPQAPENWRELRIPKNHLIAAGSFGAFILIGLISFFTIFASSPSIKPTKNPDEKLKEALAAYPAIVPSYNSATGSLFLTGHVLTTVDHKELLYIIKNLPFVSKLEDYSVIDELAWKSMNSLLSTYPEWQGITMHSPKPGRFVLRGYLDSLEKKEKLTEYMNLNFPYLDRLENLVVVEKTLELQIASLLISKGFGAVQYTLSDGVLVLSGGINKSQASSFKELVEDLKALSGMREVNNYVTVITADSATIDLSSQYKISGFSSAGKNSEAVQINGKIYTRHSLLDGMRITDIKENSVLLEKDGLKYKITYNQH